MSGKLCTMSRNRDGTERYCSTRSIRAWRSEAVVAVVVKTLLAVKG